MEGAAEYRDAARSLLELLNKGAQQPPPQSGNAMTDDMVCHAATRLVR
jgi:hypothetical protein